MVTHRTILQQNLFSFTEPVSPLINHEWLGGVIFYIFYWLSGDVGLIVLKGVTISLAFTLLFIHLNKSGVRLTVAFIAVVLSVVSAQDRFQFRPLIFTFFFIIVSWILLESSTGEFQDGPTGRFYDPGPGGINWQLWILPVIFLFWANLHGGFLAGLGMVGVYIAFSWFDFAWYKNPLLARKALQITAVGVCSVAATLINPHGYKTILFLLGFASSGLKAFTVSEWLPPNRAFLRLPMAYFAFLSYGFWMINLVFFRKSEPIRNGAPHFFFSPTFCLSLIFLAAFLHARRHMDIFILLLTPVFAIQANTLLNNLFRSIPLFHKKVITKSFSGLAILIGSVIILQSVFFNPDYFRQFGFRPRLTLFPKEALLFMKENKIYPRMLNSYNFGGYLCWAGYPKYRVFIDGRLGMTYSNNLMEDYLDFFKMRSGLEKVSTKYQIEAILIEYEDWRMGPSHAYKPSLNNVRFQLFSHPDWSLVYWDDVSLLYLKKSKYPQLVEKYGYHLVNPADAYLSNINKPELYSAAQNELNRNIESTQASYRAHALRGLLEYKMGDLTTAKQDFLYVAKGYPDSFVFNSLGEIFIRSNQFEQAIIYFKKALVLDPSPEQTLSRLGYCYECLGNTNLAGKYYRNAIDGNIQDKTVYLNLALIEESQNSVSDSVKIINQGLGKNPQDASLWFYLAHLYVRENQKESARQALQNAIRFGGEIYRQEANARPEFADLLR